KWIAQKLDTDYFFAHPYSSWERGLNEYTNKLIRQYIPKKEVFTNYTDKQILEFSINSIEDLENYLILRNPLACSTKC
ncbi:hypothetical protein EZS27_031011, partial [termite gut metagenome]